MGLLAQGAAVLDLLLISAAFVLAIDQVSKAIVFDQAQRQPRSRNAQRMAPQVRIFMNRRAVIALLPRRWSLLASGVAVLGALLLVGPAPTMRTSPAQI